MEVAKAGWLPLVHEVVARAQGPAVLGCPACREALDVHQPDSNVPDRLLAVCEGCGAWFLAVRDPMLEREVLLRLPDAVVLSGLLSAAGGDLRHEDGEGLRTAIGA